MFLAYENCTIRNAGSKDAALLCKWWNDGAVMAHAGFPRGIGTNPEAIKEDLSTDTDDTYRRLIIEADHIPIGEMSYRNIGNATAEIGIKICEIPMQEKGFGTRFLKMLITGLFAYGFERIVLDTNQNNTRAQHVYEKLGFQKVQVRYDCWTNQLGEPQSSVDYELFKSQFTPLF